MDAECRWEEAEGGWLGLKTDLSVLISQQTKQLNLFLTHRYTLACIFSSVSSSHSLVLATKSGTEENNVVKQKRGRKRTAQSQRRRMIEEASLEEKERRGGESS